MQDTDFSEAFCRFVQAALPSVDAAELLLAVSTQPDVWWDPAHIAGELLPALSMNAAEAARYLDLLQTRGLLEMGPDKRFRYHPASEELATQVRTLAQAYRERPVTLIRMIYALRDAKIRSFSDAFKLRRT